MFGFEKIYIKKTFQQIIACLESFIDLKFRTNILIFFNFLIFYFFQKIFQIIFSKLYFNKSDHIFIWKCCKYRISFITFK